jgi:hypothetical protein
MASTESVSSFVLRGRQLKSELDAVGLVVPEEQVVIALLQGLPKAYESIVEVMLWFVQTCLLMIETI